VGTVVNVFILVS